MDELIRRHDWWERGEGLDLWSIPHFLFGAIAGFAPSFGVSFFTGLIITIILAILWEVGEMLFRIKESKKNVVLDVILSGVAYLLIAGVFSLYPLQGGPLLTALSALCILDAFMIFTGWRAYRHRKERSTT